MKSSAAVLIAATCVCARSCRGEPSAPAASRVAGASAPAAASKRVSPHTVAVLQSDRNIVTTTDSDAARILGDAAAVFAKDDGAAANGKGDVTCHVSLTLEGSVKKFSFADIVEGPDDFLDICRQPGIHIVSRINWCGEPKRMLGGSWNYLGCSNEPGTCVVVLRTAADEGILWAHEFGHNRGLGHPCEPETCTRLQDDRVMHPEIAPGHVKIDADECRAVQD